MVTDENGQQTLSFANPVSWNEWVKLPVRDSDLTISTSKGAIRARAGAAHASFPETGTRPHVIRARRARVLSFFWPRGPRGAGFYQFPQEFLYRVRVV